MAQRTSPSPVIEVFVRAVRDRFPASEVAKVEAYEAKIAATTSAEDGRRARHCAHWAIELAGPKELGHPEWRRIKETHEVWKDMWFGVQYAAMGDDVGRPAPIGDVEVEWVEDAVRVAEVVGTSVGWDEAPWEQLLAELIAMEPVDELGAPFS